VNRESGGNGIVLPSCGSAAVSAVAASQQLFLAKAPGRALLPRMTMGRIFVGFCFSRKQEYCF